MTLPILPITDEIINQYNDTLDKGDRIRIEPNSPCQMLVLLPHSINGKLNNANYHQNSAGVLLAERDSYTREGLSENAFKKFYTQAYTLQAHYERNCSATNPR